MSNFYEELKQFILDEEVENKKVLIPYYEALYQLHNDACISELLSDCEKYNIHIYYEQASKNEYYTDGRLIIHLYDEIESDTIQGDIEHHYVIELKHDDRPYRYCMCTPEMEGYNPMYDCCGNGCDANFPSVCVSKVHDVVTHSFKGVERDLWALEDKWKGDYEIEQEEKLRLDKIEQLKSHIARQQLELEALQNT